MGKSKPGLFTPVTGKVGGVVYYYRNGKQTQRLLVTPSNPKTTAQQATRLKMAFAGRLSRVVPAAALEGFGGSRTDRRSFFNSNLLINSVVSENRCSIAFNDVVFSSGSLGVQNGHSVSAGSSLSTRRSLTIQVLHTATEPPLQEGYGERYVVLCVNAATSQFDYCETGLLNMPAGSATTADTTVYIRIGDKVSDYLALVYVVPFLAVGDDGSDRSVRYSYIGAEDGTLVLDALTGESLGSPEVFGMSQYITYVTLQPPHASQSVAPATRSKVTRES